jgi:hypothetical protein
MTLPRWFARIPAENDDEVPEGIPGCRCTLPGVPSAFCPYHGEGLACPESLRAYLIHSGWPVIPGAERSWHPLPVPTREEQP